MFSFLKRRRSSTQISPIPEFHPTTLIRQWSAEEGFSISDALTGVAIFGATGSGKTSGPGKHLAYGYLAAGFGGLVLTAKLEERQQWEQWCKDTGRFDDLVIVDQEGPHHFNFLDYEASRHGNGAGLGMNVVALLDEVAGAMAGSAGKSDGGGDSNQFFKDSLHHMNVNLVDLPLLANLPISLPLMRAIVNSAPTTQEQVPDTEWQKTSPCFATLCEAEVATRGTSRRPDYEECANYWLNEYPALSGKTRGIISLSFSMLVRPFLTNPLRSLFSTDTTVTPEDAFDGKKIILVDLPIQEYRSVGKVAQLVFKYCFQVAVLRRAKPQNGHLRPVFLWCDEAQNFLTEFDAEYQAVARSAGGCSVFLTQNYESYKRVLGNEAAVDSLLGNLQTKIFSQNSGFTNEWASKLLGERFLDINSSSVNRGHEGHQHSGISTSEQRRHFIEPASFTTLKRGGFEFGCQVEAFVYQGGKQFLEETTGEWLPYKHLTFDQQ